MPDAPADPSDSAQEALAGLREVFAVIAPQFEKFRVAQSALVAAAAPIAQALLSSMRAQPRILPYLADCGWHVTYQFPIPIFAALDELSQAGNHAEVDRVMCQLAKENLAQTEAKLAERFPARAAILKDAFDAHRAGKFNLSVPTLLAQADDVGCEVLKISRHLFNNKNRTKALE